MLEDGATITAGAGSIHVRCGQWCCERCGWRWMNSAMRHSQYHQVGFWEPRHRGHIEETKKKRPNMIDQKPCPNKSQGILRFAHLLRRDLFAPVIHVVGWCRGDTSWSVRTLTRYNVTRLTCQNYAMVRPLSRFGRILAWHWTVAIALGLQKVVSDTGPMGPTT